MKKKFGRLFNTKTAEENSDKQVELGEKTSRRSELAKKAIDAICNNRPPATHAVDTPVIPMQEIQAISPVNAGKEAESKLEQKEKAMIIIQKQVDVLTEKINWIKDETAEKIAEVKSKFEQAEQELNEKADELVAANERVDQQIAERQQLEEQLEQRSNKLTATNENLQQQVSERQQAIDRLQQQLEYRKAELSGTREQLEQQLAERKQSEERLQHQVAKFEQKTTESEMASKNVEEHIAKLDERLDALTDTCQKAAEVESAPLTICECCGRDGIRENVLVKIDSGQFVCPSCLQALRSFKS